MSDADFDGWSFGAEHEWADIPLDCNLPSGCSYNRKDYTVVNSNGIANDPKGKTWAFGGEINTRPTYSISAQVSLLRELLDVLPQARINHRSNLHIHVRVPRLRTHLLLLQRVQRYIHTHMPAALKIVEPIEAPDPSDLWKDGHSKYRVEEYNGAVRRYKRRVVSHQTLLPSNRVEKQMQARFLDEFFEAEVPHSKDRVLWHLQPRVCVNIRQLRETDTIEFRHFPGTLDMEEFRSCLLWCRNFLRSALRDAPVEPLLQWAREQTFPSFPPYVHWREERYRMTCHDGTLTPDTIAANIRKILDEDRAKETRARSVSR